MNIKLKKLLSGLPLITSTIFLVHFIPHHAFKSLKRLIFGPLLEYKPKFCYLFAFFGTGILFLLYLIVYTAGKLEFN